MFILRQIVLGELRPGGKGQVIRGILRKGNPRLGKVGQERIGHTKLCDMRRRGGGGKREERERRII